jgi:uroporphyrinogen-III synthase
MAERDGAFWEQLLEGADACVFTSGSTVEGFAALCGDAALRGMRAVGIGEETAARAAAFGAKTFVSDNATMESLARSITGARERGEL